MSAASVIIDAVLVREGGFVENPADRGGPTKFGITLATLTDHRANPCDLDDIKNLSLTEAREIYLDRYVNRPGFHLLGSEPLQAVMVDTGVLSGPAAATKMLQKALGLAADGILGPQTLHEANAHDGASLGVRVSAERIRFLGELVTKDPTQAVFCHGWMNRVADQLELLV